MSGVKDGQTITVVGAGLVGSLLSLYLARRGYRVEVYERRPDMRKEVVDAGRSINLAVSTRGLHGLRGVGLEDEVLRVAVPMRGRMIHPVKGDVVFQRYGKDDSQCIYSISRAGLNRLLMNAAESSGKVKIHFNRRALSFDGDRGTLTLGDETSEATLEREAPIVLGTDGASSAVRNAVMSARGANFSEEALDYGYKELIIPAGPGGSYLIEKHALHIWPRGTYMLIALPNEEGSFTCTLFLPFKGPASFEALATKAIVGDFFRKSFPDAVPLIPDLEDAFFAHPTGSMVTVKCKPWHLDGKALLLGDAAHAIVPFFGQGMNCGFEDVTVLDRCLDGYSVSQVPWAKVFEEVTMLRKDNADAIADMAVENFIEMRDKVGDPRFLLRKEVEKVLEREFPGEYMSRYQLVTFSRVPYRLALDVGVIDEEILSELSRNVVSPAEVDLVLAERLIRAKLSPMLKGVRI